MKLKDCVASNDYQFKHNLEMFRKQFKRNKAKRKQERKNRSEARKNETTK